MCWRSLLRWRAKNEAEAHGFGGFEALHKKKTTTSRRASGRGSSDYYHTSQLSSLDHSYCPRLSSILREGRQVLLLLSPRGCSPASLLSESDPLLSEAEEAADGAPRCLTRESGTLVSLSPSSYNKFTRPPCKVYNKAGRREERPVRALFDRGQAKGSGTDDHRESAAYFIEHVVAIDDHQQVGEKCERGWGWPCETSAGPAKSRAIGCIVMSRGSGTTPPGESISCRHASFGRII